MWGLGGGEIFVCPFYFLLYALVCQSSHTYTQYPIVIGVLFLSRVTKMKNTQIKVGAGY